MVSSIGILPNLNRFIKRFLGDQSSARTGLNLSNIFTAVLIVLVGLAFTGPEGKTVIRPAAVPRLDYISAPEPPHTLPHTDVTRAEITMLSPLVNLDIIEKDNLPLEFSKSVSDALRHPIRLLNTQNYPLSLRDLVFDTLTAFGHPVTQDDPLFLLLVQLLAERQSNDYIEAALQQAYAKGEIRIPHMLEDPDQGVDIQVLLGGLIYMYEGNHGLPTPAAKARKSRSEGNLAAMALD